MTSAAQHAFTCPNCGFSPRKAPLKAKMANEKDDPVECILLWIRQYGKHFGVDLNPGIPTGFTLARMMYDSGKDLAYFEKCLQELIREKRKPKGMGWIIVVLRDMLGRKEDVA